MKKKTKMPFRMYNRNHCRKHRHGIFLIKAIVTIKINL